MTKCEPGLCPGARMVMAVLAKCVSFSGASAFIYWRVSVEVFQKPESLRRGPFSFRGWPCAATAEGDSYLVLLLSPKHLRELALLCWPNHGRSIGFLEAEHMCKQKAELRTRKRRQR
ncbi:hypothetical protein BD289DRAFT_108086 [Coniella lustricola]|uniref:Uncharacterized protein n=1 Tax=Coniella lustricola TaxID=2025994 RepID=A0A2T3AGR8_9PEZI|nr:hypothetical protein BD289DRAFT_108086 [Coniella lustricola]